MTRMSSFSSFPLAPALLQTLQALAHHEPTPVQRLAIPVLLEGRDVLGVAKTGTGKTAAFALPMVQHLS